MSVSGAVSPDGTTRKKQSQMQGVWRRFKKNRTAMVGLVIIICMILLAVFANVIAPGNGVSPGYDIQNLDHAFEYPSRDHIMGTDNMGRDIFARVVHGSRVSLQVGFVVVGIACLAGSTLGSIAGFYSGIYDNIIMRSIDILLAIPSILLAITIAAALKPGLTSVMIAVGISAIPGFARIVRASVLTLRDQEYIEAARSIGANDIRIIAKHILPNCMAPIIVQATLGMANAILSAAGLSFLGLGIQLPIPEWGAMLSAGRRYIRDFWPMVIFPGFAIVIIIFALNMMGDGLRDAFDPKLRK